MRRTHTGDLIPDPFDHVDVTPVNPLDAVLEDIGFRNSGLDNLQADPDGDPLEILCECERLDELECVQCGTHLELYYSNLRITKAKR